MAAKKPAPKVPKPAKAKAPSPAPEPVAADQLPAGTPANLGDNQPLDPVTGDQPGPGCDRLVSQGVGLPPRRCGRATDGIHCDIH